jgi:hypothetical protein
MKINSYRQFKSEGSHYFEITCYCWKILPLLKLLVSISPTNAYAIADKFHRYWPRMQKSCHENDFSSYHSSFPKIFETIFQHKKKRQANFHSSPFRVAFFNLDGLSSFNQCNQHCAPFFLFINGNRHFNDTQLLWPIRFVGNGSRFLISLLVIIVCMVVYRKENVLIKIQIWNKVISVVLLLVYKTTLLKAEHETIYFPL